MKADHPLAENIFERLSRFTPRQGEKRKREPLEDYITEATAFLLLTSEQFQKRFVSEVLSIPPLNWPAVVATQAVDSGFDGRADLVIFADADDQRRVGIEVKRNADFQPDQLKRMREGFPFAAFLLAPESYIRKHWEEISNEKISVANLEDVHQICEDLAKIEVEPNKTLLAQFAEFLHAKGHARVKIYSNPMKIQSIADAAELLDEWSAFLSKLQAELGLERSGQWAVPRWDGGGGRWPDTSFYGVYGPRDSYAGFKIGRQNDVDCYYEENWPVESLVSPLPLEIERGNDGKAYVHITCPYPCAVSGDKSKALLQIFRDLQDRVRDQFKKFEKPGR